MLAVVEAHPGHCKWGADTCIGPLPCLLFKTTCTLCASPCLVLQAAPRSHDRVATLGPRAGHPHHHTRPEVVHGAAPGGSGWQGRLCVRAARRHHRDRAGALCSRCVAPVSEPAESIGGARISHVRVDAVACPLCLNLAERTCVGSASPACALRSRCSGYVPPCCRQCNQSGEGASLCQMCTSR